MRKHILLLILVFSGSLLLAQSPRMVLLEEFSQASCANCFVVNPVFDSLLAANASKAVLIKYETSWPGVDPMNAQNPTEAANRVAYYGISGDPDAWMDGVDYASPPNITQAVIDNEQAFSSPFSMQLVHWFNSTNDSVFVSCRITCSQNTTMALPKMRIGLIEKTISFVNAPGTNGEKTFVNVMRKMFPDEGGTALSTTWLAGQTKTISLKEKIPAYIYNLSELATIAWIQDDSDKSVKQAGYCATATAPSTLPPVPDFTSDLTASCDGLIHFQDQSGLFPTYLLWDFGDSNTSSQQNPTHQYTSGGTYTVKLTAGNANGSTPLSKASYVTISFSGSGPVVTNGRRCGSGIVNLSASPAGGGNLNWYDSTGVLVNTGLTYSPFITGIERYTVAEQIPNPLSVCGSIDTALGAGGGYFTANALHGLYFDVLQPCVIESVNTYSDSAGNRTIQVLDAVGTVVQSAVVNIPAGMSTVTLHFAMGIGQGYFMKLATGSLVHLFRNSGNASYPYHSGPITITGNDANASYYFYFYDWQVRKNPCLSQSVIVTGSDTCAAAGIQETELIANLSVYPNPSTGSFSVRFQTAGTNSKYVLKILDVLGQVIYEETLNPAGPMFARQLDLSSFGKGIYLLVVSDNKNLEMKKLFVR